MEEVLHTYASDGLVLEGLRHGVSGNELAVVYTHGVIGSSFLLPHVRVGRALAAEGLTVIAGNNRGAGIANALLQRSGPMVLAGTWFEHPQDSVKDISAWIDVATAGGARRIVLFGHSLGAAKVVLYASERADPRVTGIVLASPGFRWVHSFVDARAAARAKAAVGEGRPEELLTLESGVRGRMSAATVLDYAEGRVDAWAEAAPRLAAIRCPLLAYCGSEEPSICGQSDLDRIAALVPGGITSRVIKGAGHLYGDHEAEAAALVANWIRMKLSCESDR